MKHRYKVLIGEWVSVYTTTTAFITTEKDIEKMTPSQVANMLDYDDEVVFETEDEDFDWTTEEHEDWDRNGKVKILDKQEIKD